jgi:hypothetical protein
MCQGRRRADVADDIQRCRSVGRVDSRSPAVKGGHPISPKDLDEIVVWASGGTPHAWTGDPNAALPEVKVENVWRLEPPDLARPMTAVHTIAPGTLDGVFSRRQRGS